jgi:hypothetical protein
VKNGEAGGSGKYTPALKRARAEAELLRESLKSTKEEVEKLRQERDRLKQEVEKLKKELASLRKPPTWVKPDKPEEEKKKAKKKGPKFGHTPHVRKRPEQIDETLVVFPERCPEHGHELPFPSESKWYSHIQIELPEPKRAEVIEYLVGSSYCSVCKKYHSAVGRMANSLYGPRLHATVVYWKFELGLTLPKIQKLLKSQHELTLSTGQIAEILNRSGKAFQAAHEDLKTSLSDAANLNADETGWRVDGKNHWLWSFSNSTLSYYTIEETRGQKVVEEVLGKSFSGVLSSDFYNAYEAIEGAKQKCWAHLLRDLKELHIAHPKNLEITYFASRLKTFFDRGKKLREEKKKGKDIDFRLKRLHTETQNFGLRRFRHPELKILAKRIWKYRSELYVFIEKDLEPTNNAAEREIRPSVLMRKTSYGNRSTEGANHQAILMSMIRTSQKRGQNFVCWATPYLAGYT